MAKPTGFIAEVPFKLHGIPCTIGVLDYFVQAPHRGSAHTCDSDVDFYGYTDVEWQVLDRRGYSAAWLERKLTENDQAKIEAAISRYFATAEEY
jgi:hypothetical protein